ncbi:MAG: CNNM domain-containing protein [Fodinibius sp.]|nr:CNNM domain-containing protein [Fodinibius sp.]
MLERPRRLLATILIGNTFANIVASVLAAVVTGNMVAYFGLPEVLVYLLEVIILTFMILILSEITPKIIAINNPLKACPARQPVYLCAVYVLLQTCLSSIIANSTLSLEERLPKPNSKMTSEDIMTMAEVSEQEGSIKSDEREIIENVIEFGSISVREIMTSRVNIVAISTSDSLDEVLSLDSGEGLSRMPIYENGPRQ